MITRDVHQLYAVPAFINNARFTGCTLAGYTCTESGATSAIGSSEFFPGFMIDRLGLPENFKSLMVAPNVYGDLQTSVGTGNIAVIRLSVGLQHTSATGGTWANYSTQDWIADKGLWRQSTATSTANLDYTVVQRDVGLTSAIGIGGLLSSSTSTGTGQDMTAGTSSTSLIFYAGPGPAFDLAGAKRFVRVLFRLQHLTTGDVCTGAGTVHMSGVAVFGEPDEAQPPYAPFRRILVTSGCAT